MVKWGSEVATVPFLENAADLEKAIDRLRGMLGL